MLNHSYISFFSMKLAIELRAHNRIQYLPACRVQWWMCCCVHNTQGHVNNTFLTRVVSFYGFFSGFCRKAQHKFGIIRISPRIVVAVEELKCLYVRQWFIENKSCMCKVFSACVFVWCDVAHCQIKCTQMSLFVQGLKDRPMMTSLTTVHHFSAFIDRSVRLCVRVCVCEEDKDTDSCVIMSPIHLSLFLMVFSSLCFRINQNYRCMWFQ